LGADDDGSSAHVRAPAGAAFRELDRGDRTAQNPVSAWLRLKAKWKSFGKDERGGSGPAQLAGKMLQESLKLTH